jgi:hypothetical protein
VLAAYDPERALDAYESVLSRAVQNGQPRSA